MKELAATRHDLSPKTMTPTRTSRSYVSGAVTCACPVCAETKNTIFLCIIYILWSIYSIRRTCVMFLVVAGRLIAQIPHGRGGGGRGSFVSAGLLFILSVKKTLSLRLLGFFSFCLVK